MRVLMMPHLDKVRQETESGIRRVVEAYFRYLPAFGIEMVRRREDADVVVVHAGMSDEPADVAACHGLYWSGDYRASRWEFSANANVINSLRAAKVITVPSNWVAMAMQRDMHRTPLVVPHGIDLQDWGEPGENLGYILWNKNRVGDVCDPHPVSELARRFPEGRFVTTFSDQSQPNIEVTGVLDHDRMRQTVKGAAVYLGTTKETFGIGLLEAMASGVPVLGFRWGAAPDVIVHGETGYLAEPGNNEDLAEGLIYCLKHRETLGANARQAVKALTWEAAAAKVAAAYTIAAQPEPATVSVVIPSFNYAGKVGKAIESVLRQTYAELESIIVVDDGSTDDTEGAVFPWQAKDDRVKYIKQANAGVACACNRGIAGSDSKYVCCLDADDTIEPEFLQACVDALERDRSLGIAYTGLMTISADGHEELSRWPGPWDFDAQLQRRNQVPTCCVFRRSMWEALGGYRQRYAPKGAGAEDAEFWLRCGAHGWGAKQVTDAGLFRYSFKTGRVTGDPNYREVDWTELHPWAGKKSDGLHPFASYAKPAFLSHPVRAYDRPAVSVIIPVGPGHEKLVIDALDSLEAQTFRNWEVIIVFDPLVQRVENGHLLPDKAAFDAYTHARDAIAKAYPFARIHCTDLSNSPKGAGFARNAGASLARASFLLFLDADDWLYPEAIAKMLQAWEQDAAIIYTDYVGKTTLTDPAKLDPELQKRIYSYDPATGAAVIGHRSSDYECERAIRQPEEEGEPYLWCNVTCLIPKLWHDAINGFDESLKTWEDIDYHWRMARAGYCYSRLPEELMVYRFNTGERRQLGLASYRSVVEYIRAKYREVPAMGCGCRGGSKNAGAGQVLSSQAAFAQLGAQEQTKAMDENFIMVRYLHPNKGQHMVVGASTKTRYGYRAGGDSFLVHKDDVNGQPHLYEPIGAAPRAPAPPPAAPMPAPISTFSGKPSEASMAVSLQSLPGVTPEIEAQLKDLGRTSLADVKAMTLNQWMRIKGVGKTKGEAIMAALAELT